VQVGDLVATIDAADLALVAPFNWRPLVEQDGRVYAHAWHNRLHLYMHRLIIGAGTRDLVDHRNGDGLDNRRINLRLATPKQNSANRVADRRRRGTTSHYKGVSWKTARSKWVAHIHVDGRTRYLGQFDDERAAAAAYDDAATQAWGDFARLNLTAEERSAAQCG
jgi:hypothetical protein